VELERVKDRVSLVLIIFDVTNRSSFDSVIRWNRVAESFVEAKKLLIANKIDLQDLRQVDLRDVEMLTSTCELQMKEVSALTLRGIDDLLASVAAIAKTKRK